MITLSKPLLAGEFGPVTPTSAVASLDDAMHRLKAIGIPPPGGSRLHQARAQIARPDEFAHDLRRSGKARRITAEAMRVAFNYHQIAKTTNPTKRPYPKKFCRDLQKSYVGHLDPGARDELTSAARNLEFQLSLVPWFVAGEKPIWYEEPDLCTVYWFEKRGIAAKRVQSPAKILERTQDAARQVKKRIGTGFVAIAIDNYSPAFQARLPSHIAPSKVFARLPELKQAAAWCREHAPWILSFLAFGTLARWRLVGPIPAVEFSYINMNVFLTEDLAGTDRLRDYFEHLTKHYLKRTIGAQR